jgi:hypothetical protein
VSDLLLGNADAESFQTAMREGLGKSGYTEGQNLRFELRSRLVKNCLVIPASAIGFSSEANCVINSAKDTGLALHLRVHLTRHSPLLSRIEYIFAHARLGSLSC